MRAAMYLRQSLDRDKTKLAVTRQRKGCLAQCEQRGWEPVEYVDNNISATNGAVRPAYQQMLADIRDGKIDAVVVWDLDRLHRQPRELEDFIDLADAHNLALATVTGEVDLSTDNGRLFARIKGAVGKSETERKSARQKAAGRQKAERGLPQWRKAFGYLDGPNGPEPDPVTAPLVKQAYADVLAGCSLRDIAGSFNNAGAYGLTGKPWTGTAVGLFLRKPRNCGLRSYDGEIVGEGAWTPLVDESTWRAAQSVLNAPGRSPGRKSVRRHLLTGVMLCGKPGCGGYLSATWTPQKVLTYSCKQCRGVSVRAEHVEPWVYEVVGGRLAMPDAVDLLKKKVHDTAEAERLRVEAQTLLAQIAEANAEYDDGIIDGKRLAGRTARATEKLEKIEKRQQDQQRLRVLDGIPLGTPEAVDAVMRLSPDRFRAVLKVLCTITVLPVGKGGGGRGFNKERVRFYDAETGEDWEERFYRLYGSLTEDGELR